MSFEPSFEEQELLAETVERESARMSTQELVTGGAVAAAFVASVAGLWLLAPPRPFELVPALVCLAVLVLAMLVRFDTPFGFTDATQLGFVPLLFAMPLPLVPILVAFALAVSWLPEVWSGELRPARLLQVPWSAFFSVGPVAVFVITHVEPRHAGPLILLAALAGQFAVDFAGSVLHCVRIRRVSLSSLLHTRWICAIDAALSCIALVVAEDVHTAPLAALSLVPLLGLLAVFGQERHQRLVSMLELSSAYRGLLRHVERDAHRPAIPRLPLARRGGRRAAFQRWQAVRPRVGRHVRSNGLARRGFGGDGRRGCRRSAACAGRRAASRRPGRVIVARPAYWSRHAAITIFSDSISSLKHRFAV